MMQVVEFLTVSVLLTATTYASQMNVSTEQSLNATCGGNVTLPCTIDSGVTLTDFQWTDGNKILCEKGTKDKESPSIHCVYKKSLGQVTLTIQDVQPNNSGTYYCKLFTSSSHEKSSTFLTVSDCQIRMSPRQNHAWSSGSQWISLLISLPVLLSPILDQIKI